EAVLSVLSVQQGLIYPNLRFTTPIEGLGLIPETRFRKGERVRHVLSNSFGFGGNCTSLVFSE
ncbi:MAG: beta-ketoacyl-[acyl-carrier-protein] synthase family protein, partial [Thermoanaerobaculia bacterium]|nr:beta-ketoacyl-[acyl-carrier-protein] synthase family protein [Thermoanaerobaculia bacterium]